MPLNPGDRGVSVDAHVIRRLDASLDILVAKGAPIATLFYQALFTNHPSLRALFPSDTTQLERKLIDTLVGVVGMLNNPANASATLRAMGIKHRQYGAKREHYPIVCRLLLQSMSHEFGDEWTEQLALEWFQVLELVSRHMIEAAEDGRR